MSDAVSALVADIRSGLAAEANREIGEQQQKYMKSDIPFFGLKAPQVRTVMKPLLKQHTLRSRGEWEAAILTLWDEVTHREEWYAALAIARYGRYRTYRTDVESLKLYDHLIREGAWWDVGDELAIHLVGEVLMANRVEAQQILRAWSTDEHLWIRRCSILSQNRHRDQTDPVLLRDCILPSIDDTDFFSRKAIGWALRDYSRFNPEWVLAFVDEFSDRLSGLSRREAIRNIPSD